MPSNGREALKYKAEKAMAGGPARQCLSEQNALDNFISLRLIR